ncbi:hypothetical protein EYF80_017589 [Liparis tanakae]|uniref:Uncharacterized protein n=1 Tax=Liparis tanakae TaxID=230148 RepID=A0A4Z2I315_9TELE|nr:hypothetical protein EYF80_017589 [Liparis tanakae]
MNPQRSRTSTYRRQPQCSRDHLVLCGGGHGVHLFVATVIVLVGVGVEHLQREHKELKNMGPHCQMKTSLLWD